VETKGDNFAMASGKGSELHEARMCPERHRATRLYALQHIAGD
jgi:hypothetical protein